MCLSIPAKIIEVKGDTATVSVGGNRYEAGLQMLQDAKKGEYVLLHAGFAIQKISDQEARETLDLLREMNGLDGPGNT